MSNINISNSEGESQEAIDNALIVGVVTSIIIGTFFWLCFLLIVCICPRVYIWRPEDQKEWCHLGIRRVFKLTHAEVLNKYGFDAFLYVTFVQMLLFLLIVIGLFNWIILMPLNLTGSMKDATYPRWNITTINGDQLDELDVANFDFDNYDHTYYTVMNATPGHNVSGTAIFSLANLNLDNPNEKWRLIAHTLSVVFSTVLICICLHFYYKQWVKMRLKLKHQPLAANYTVRITGFDKSLISQDKLAPIFARLFASPVVSIHPVPNVPWLDHLRKRYYHLVKLAEISEANHHGAKTKAMLMEIENMEVQYNNLRRSPPQWNYKFRNRFSASTTYPDAQITDMVKHVHAVPPKAGLPKPHKVASKKNFKNLSFYGQAADESLCNTAYVTFEYIGDARLCSTAILGDSLKPWDVSPAVDPDAIIWRNHYPDKGSIERVSRKITGMVLVTFITLFLIIPITFAAGLSNLNNLAQIEFLRPIIEGIQGVRYVSDFVASLVPQIAIQICLRIVEPMIEWITMIFDLPRTRVENDNILLLRFYVLQAFNILLGGLLATSFFGIIDQLGEIAQAPFSILTIIGTTIPRQVNFYLNFLLLAGIADPPYQLFNIEKLFWGCIRCCRAKSERQYGNVWRPDGMSFYGPYADRIFVFLIVLVYSAISPLILLFGLFYFAATISCDLWQMIYTQEPDYEGHGLAWPGVFNKMISCMLIQQVIMLGIFILIQFIFGIVFMAFCLLGTIVFAWITYSRFWPVGFYGTTLNEDRDPLQNRKTAEPFSTAYVHKSLKKIPAEQRIQFDPSALFVGEDQTLSSSSDSDSLLVIDFEDEDINLSNITKAVSQKALSQRGGLSSRRSTKPDVSLSGSSIQSSSRHNFPLEDP